ncbi:MAG: hypothetical protein IJF23_01225, partial [Clostridia bacterium]|nr:hypothetical protein [Clostridia bacterium]
MSVRNVKRFIGIFVLAFLVIFIVVIIKLPQSEDIIVDDDDLIIPDIPDNNVVVDPIPEPEP